MVKLRWWKLWNSFCAWSKILKFSSVQPWWILFLNFISLGTRSFIFLKDLILIIDLNWPQVLTQSTRLDPLDEVKSCSNAGVKEAISRIFSALSKVRNVFLFNFEPYVILLQKCVWNHVGAIDDQVQYSKPLLSRKIEFCSIFVIFTLPAAVSGVLFWLHMVLFSSFCLSVWNHVCLKQCKRHVE